MQYLIGAIIGILVYSLILTIITIYQDQSSYFVVEVLDFIMAGPFGWLLLGILPIIQFLYKRFFKGREKKEKRIKVRNQKYIAKVVKKIVKNYRNSSYNSDYIDFNKSFTADYSDDIVGYDELLVNRARNERLNIKFKSLMRHQKDETVNELLKYFHKVTEKEMEGDNCTEWFIKKNKEKTFYALNTV